MNMKTFEAGPLGANNYLLIDGNEAVMIDCSAVTEDEMKALDGINLKYILLTHGHFDHVLGVNEMKAHTGAKVLVFEEDIPRMEECTAIMHSFGAQEVETPLADEFLKDDQTIKFGNTEIKVIHTPGHTEGGACFLIDGKLFSGDTLFKDYVGRCDLPGGNFNKISESVKNILFKLNDDIVVYPGHGETTAIGYEKKYNEIL